MSDIFDMFEKETTRRAKQVEFGRNRMASMTPEERSEFARLGALKRWENHRNRKGEDMKTKPQSVLLRPEEVQRIKNDKDYIVEYMEKAAQSYANGNKRALFVALYNMAVAERGEDEVIMHLTKEMNIHPSDLSDLLYKPDLATWKNAIRFFKAVGLRPSLEIVDVIPAQSVFLAGMDMDVLRKKIKNSQSYTLGLLNKVLEEDTTTFIETLGLVIKCWSSMAEVGDKLGIPKGSFGFHFYKASGGPKFELILNVLKQLDITLVFTHNEKGDNDNGR